MKIKINIDIKVGRVVKFFVLSDLFLLLGWGLIEPVFSVFIVQRIAGATLITVGIAAAVYWILKSILQIPIANYLDKTMGEKDDFMALVGGLLIAGLSSFAFGWASSVWQLYAIQALHAVGFALYVPSWSAIFSRHLDKDRISFDWSLDSTAAGIAAGISGLLSGIIASIFGFLGVFILGGILSIAAAFILIIVPDLILPKPQKTEVVVKEKTPTPTRL
jgi:MFS family permease